MILKTSWDYENIDGSIDIFMGLNIDEELYGGGTMNFTIFRDSYTPILEEFKKIELFEVKDGTDQSVFTGYISRIDYDFDKINIECRNEKMWMMRKICYNAISNKPPTEILEQMVSECNARMPSYEMKLSFSTLLTDSKPIDIEKGATYYNALDDMADLWKCAWTVKYGKIYFGNFGLERDDEFLLITNSQNVGSIISVDYTRDTVEVANALLGSHDGAYIEKEEVSYLPRVEKFISMETSEESELEDELEERKSLRREVQIEPNTENIFLNVGDSVQVDIADGDDLYDFSERVTIHSRKIDFSEGYPEITLEVSNSIGKINKPENFLNTVVKNLTN